MSAQGFFLVATMIGAGATAWQSQSGNLCTALLAASVAFIAFGQMLVT